MKKNVEAYSAVSNVAEIWKQVATIGYHKQ